MVGRGERWYPRIVGGVVGIACAPIDQDITIVSCGTVVLRGGWLGVMNGVALAVAVEGVVDCADAIHCSGSVVSKNIVEVTGAGSAHSSSFGSGSEVSLNTDESTGAATAHSSPFESLWYVIESTWAGSIFCSSFGFGVVIIVSGFVVGAAFAVAVCSPCSLLTDATMSSQSMSQVAGSCLSPYLVVVLVQGGMLVVEFVVVRWCVL